MKKYPPIAAVCLALLLGAAPCFAQNADQQRDFAAHVERAQSYLRQKQPALAIPELEAAAALEPDSVDVQANLGVLLFFQGKFGQAVPHLRAAVDKQAGLSKIQGLLGIAEERTSDVARAQKDLEAAFPLLQDKKFKVQVGLELVSLYTAGNDLSGASGVIAQLQKDDPQNAEVLYAAYRTYSQLAVQSMLSLSLAAPDSAQMHQMLAHEQIKRGNTNDAIAEFRKAIAINPNLPGVHFDLAELLKTSQNTEVKKEAQKEYRADLAQNPDDARAERRLGEIDQGFGLSKQAFEEFEASVKMRPDDPDANLDLAKMLIERGERDRAMALLESVVQEDPTIALAHLRLSQLYRRKGMVKESDREVGLYKQYTELKTKLNASYKQLQVQPNEIHPPDDEKK